MHEMEAKFMWVLIYMALGYWAVGKTIYRNKIIVTTYFNWFFSKLILVMLFGFVLIPWAIITTILEQK